MIVISKLEKLLKLSLGLLLFLLPWQTIWIYQEQFLNGVKWEYGTLGFYFTEVLLWVIVLLFMIWFWKRRKASGVRRKDLFKWSRDRVFLLSCLLFIVYCLLSFLWSFDLNVASQGALHIIEAFLFFFMLYLGPLSARRAMVWFISGAVVQSVLGIWQFLTQSTFSSTFLGISSHPVWEAGTSIIQGDGVGRWLRAYGGFSHPNVFGGYLVVSIIFTLVFLFDGMKNNQSRIKVFVVAGLLVQVTALFFTFSRSAWLVFGFGLVLFCCVVKKHLSFCSRRIIIYRVSSIIILIGVLTIVFFPLVQIRISGNTSHEVASVRERISGYGEAWELFKLHPLLGVGVGNYTIAVHELDSGRAGWEYQPVHNVGLLFLVELGVVGVLLSFLVALLFITYHLSLITQKEKFFVRSILFSFLLIPLVLFDHYLFSSYFGVVMIAVYFGIIFRFLHNSSTVNTQ